MANSIQLIFPYVASVTIQMVSSCFTETHSLTPNIGEEELPFNRKKPFAGPGWPMEWSIGRFSDTLQKTIIILFTVVIIQRTSQTQKED